MAPGQDMSRVRQEYPQTTPGEARKGSCIRKAYGEHRTTDIEHPTSNEAKPPEAPQSHMGANAEGRMMNAEATLRPP